jgi:hypothetical protein
MADEDVGTAQSGRDHAVPPIRGDIVDEDEIESDDVQRWRRPGVHRVNLHGRVVWVRVDSRGIAAMTSVGPEALPPRPLTI